MGALLARKTELFLGWGYNWWFFAPKSVRRSSIWRLWWPVGRCVGFANRWLSSRPRFFHIWPSVVGFGFDRLSSAWSRVLLQLGTDSAAIIALSVEVAALIWREFSRWDNALGLLNFLQRTVGLEWINRHRTLRTWEAVVYDTFCRISSKISICWVLQITISSFSLPLSELSKRVIYMHSCIIRAESLWLGHEQMVSVLLVDEGQHWLWVVLSQRRVWVSELISLVKGCSVWQLELNFKFLNILLTESVATTENICKEYALLSS